MFYLSGRRYLSGNPETDTEDEFGWFLGDQERIEDKIYNIYSIDDDNNNNKPPIVRSAQFNCGNGVGIGVKSMTRGSRSSGSMISVTSTADFEDVANYSIVKDLTKRESSFNDSAGIEHIEMNSLKGVDDLDIKSIEEDADRVFTSSFRSAREDCHFIKINDETNDDSNEHRAICYTPERLVRSQEYRILTPSPRYYAIPRSTPTDLDQTSQRKYHHWVNRRRLGDLIDTKQFGGSQLEALLDPGAPEIRVPISTRRKLNFRDRTSSKKTNFDHDSPSGLHIEPLEIANQESPVSFETPDLLSSRSSYERCDNTWEEDNAKIVRSSQEDTSGVHSNDWSTETPSDVQPPICLCDELATASRSFTNVAESRGRVTAINEVVSILEDLETDPNRAALLLEEDDRFCDSTSGHDHLTRLALTIESDGAVPPDIGDTENLLIRLRDKVDRLQETNREIFKDVGGLRRDFQYNEDKVNNLMNATITLRQDMNEMKYLDDLLNLLNGELERISRRNWPFVLGHNSHLGEEMNLVV